MENTADAALRSAEQAANEARTLSQRVAAYSKRLTTDGDSLAEEVTGLSKKVDRSLKEATKHLDESDKWLDVIKELELARCIIYGNGAGGDLRKLTRIPKPAILGMLLGRSTNVVTVRKDQSLQLKEEYHKFRNRAAYTMFIMAAFLKFWVWRAKAREGGEEGFSFSPVVTVGVQLFLCWLLYFYTAAALRESVLRMNGSHIRPWWIHHHYWSIGTALLMLSLPVDSPSYRRATELFLGWGLLQAVVILMQNKYQRRRMYTRIAMGKNSPHDVVCGESSGGHGQLVLLYPMLFCLQGYQLYIGADMMLGTYWAFLTPEGYVDFERKEMDLWGSRGVFLAGVAMIYMSLMNFRYTVATIMGKSAAREKALVRSSLMKARQQVKEAAPAK